MDELCPMCGKSLTGSVSEWFCSELCQRHWWWSHEAPVAWGQSPLERAERMPGLIY